MSNRTSNKTVYRDPALLKVHRLAKDLPQLADDDAQFETILRDISERGIDNNLKITEDNHIADGRHRWRCARRLKLAEIPCDIIPDDQVFSVVTQSLTQRRHYTKSALAYMLVPIFRVQASTQQQLEALGAARNLSLTLLKYAEQIHAIYARTGEYAKYPAELIAKFRESTEAEILAGNASLGPIVAGFAGFISTAGKTKNVRSALDLWDRSFSDLQRRFTTWDKFDLETKASVTARLTPFVESMPLELIQKLATKLTAELKHRKDAQ